MVIILCYVLENFGIIMLQDVMFINLNTSERLSDTTTILMQNLIMQYEILHKDKDNNLIYFLYSVSSITHQKKYTQINNITKYSSKKTYKEILERGIFNVFLFT